MNQTAVEWLEQDYDRDLRLMVEEDEWEGWGPIAYFRSWRRPAEAVYRLIFTIKDQNG